MRFAVISDIHANREALEAVLADIQRWQPDAVYCLGDVIGYGPEPGAVIELLLKNAITSVRGNHELAVMTPRFLEWFNPIARVSIEKTTGLLRPGEVAAISRFPPVMSAHRCRFVHGFPPDRVKTYLFEASEYQLIRTLGQAVERICFVGHTHELEVVAYDGKQVTHRMLTREVVGLDAGSRYLVNIGSVGQPRDGDNHAKYVLWDDGAQTLDIRYVAYDIEAAVGKIMAAGLPESHALRLR